MCSHRPCFQHLFAGGAKSFVHVPVLTSTVARNPSFVFASALLAALVRRGAQVVLALPVLVCRACKMPGTLLSADEIRLAEMWYNEDSMAPAEVAKLLRRNMSTVMCVRCCMHLCTCVLLHLRFPQAQRQHHASITPASRQHHGSIAPASR